MEKVSPTWFGCPPVFPLNQFNETRNTVVNLDIKTIKPNFAFFWSARTNGAWLPPSSQRWIATWWNHKETWDWNAPLVKVNPLVNISEICGFQTLNANPLVYLRKPFLLVSPPCFVFLFKCPLKFKNGMEAGAHPPGYRDVELSRFNLVTLGPINDGQYFILNWLNMNVKFWDLWDVLSTWMFYPP